MNPKWQTWQKGDNTVMLEKDSVSNSGRYYVNVHGSQEVIDQLNARLTPHEEVYCEYAKDRQGGKYADCLSISLALEGSRILELVGNQLKNRGYQPPR